MRPSRVMILVFYFMLFAFLTNSSSAKPQVVFSKKILEAAQDEFNQAPRAIRFEHPMAPTTFGDSGGESFYFLTPRRLKRLGEGGQKFTIKKIRFESEYVGIEFVSGSGAKPRIRIYPDKEMTQHFYDVIIPGILRDLFEFGDAWSPLGVVGNSKFAIAHRAGANHLPILDLREFFPNMQDAETAGYRPCPQCFEIAQWVQLEGYLATRKAAIEAARLREVVFPPIADGALQKEIQELGEKIVGGFPIDTMGYTYEFKILTSELPWSESFPTGFVFVSDRLLDMCEDPIELEFVLAREIAEVELFIMETSKDPFEDSEDSARRYSRMYAEEQRSLQRELDHTALLYLAQAHRDSSVLHAAKTVLRKLQVFSEPVPIRKTDDYDLRPSIAERITHLESSFIIPPETSLRFCDYSDGETVATVELLGIATNERNARIFLRLSATDLMNKVGRVPLYGHIRDSEGKRREMERPKYPNLVGRNQTRIFYYDIQTPFHDEPDSFYQKLTRPMNIDLGNIGGASNWEICPQ